jgi:hypothetical protein
VTLANTLDMILTAAHTRDCAPPARIVFRQAMVDRIAGEDGGLRRLDTCGVPYEVDEDTPHHPGFEVHRCRP